MDSQFLMPRYGPCRLVYNLPFLHAEMSGPFLETDKMSGSLLLWEGAWGTHSHFPQKPGPTQSSVHISKEIEMKSGICFPSHI